MGRSAAAIALAAVLSGVGSAWADRPPSAQPDEKLVQELREHYGLTAYSVERKLRKVKIAVLDDGFGLYDPSRDTYDILPSDPPPVLVDRYPDDLYERNSDYFIRFGVTRQYWDDSFFKGARSLDSENRHGLYLAQAIWKLTGGQPDGPEFYLLNAKGVTNFLSAVAYAVEQKVDIVVFAQNFAYFGNGEGDGLINRAVSHATREDILWINSAGNLGKSVYTGGIRFNEHDEVLFGEKDYLEVESSLTEQKINVAVSWTDRWDRVDSQSTKDLDVIIYQVKGKGAELTEEAISDELGTRSQAPEDEGTGQRLRSLFAKEEFSLVLPERGKYRIRVRARSATADFGEGDRIRVLVRSSRPGSSGVTFRGANGEGEIFAPADHRDVIAVGVEAKFSSRGPTLGSAKRHKPEIVLDRYDSTFDSGQNSVGTSEAAAYFAAIAAMMKAQNPALDRETLLHFARGRHRGGRAMAGVDTAESPQARFLLTELQRAGSIDPRNVRWTRDAGGRRVAVIPRHPREIRAFFPDLGFPFAAPGGSGAAGDDNGEIYLVAPNRSVIEVLRGTRAALAQFLGESELDFRGQPTGELKWIELRYSSAPPTREVRSAGDENDVSRSNWATPLPSELSIELR